MWFKENFLSTKEIFVLTFEALPLTHRWRALMVLRNVAAYSDQWVPSIHTVGKNTLFYLQLIRNKSLLFQRSSLLESTKTRNSEMHFFKKLQLPWFKAYIHKKLMIKTWFFWRYEIGQAIGPLRDFCAPISITYCRIVGLIPAIPYPPKNNWKQFYNILQL